jgi:hypothetical protein
MNKDFHFPTEEEEEEGCGQAHIVIYYECQLYFYNLKNTKSHFHSVVVNYI